MVAMILKLFTLGPLRVQPPGDTPHLLVGNSAALLGFLTLQSHTGWQATRGRLAGTLWPECSEERARHLLSNTLYRLQKQLPAIAPYLHTTAESIALRHIWLDTAVFQTLSASDNGADWRAAIDLYHGDLLEELDADWAAGPRALLHETYLATLTRVCRQLAANQAEPSHADLLLAQRWVRADPLNEEAYTAVMRLYARLGRPAAARQQYQILQTTLASELGTTPTPETAALMQTFQPDPAIPRPTTLFVGRQTERAQLLAQLERLQQGRGALVLVEGEPGIGKTTLLDEMRRATEWRAITYAAGQADEISPAPFAPLATVLRTLSRQPHLATAVTELPPLLRQLITPIINPQQTAAAPAESRFVAAMPQSAALRHLLQQWLQHGPLLLLFDDVHWADAQFWTLLPTLAELTRTRPLLLVLAYRPWPLQRNEVAWAVVQKINQAQRPLHLSLSGLDAAAVRDLADAYHADAATVAELHQLSGGNPLLLHELLRQPERPASDLAPLLADRLATLPAADCEALAAASVLGREIDYAIWCALLQRPLTGADLARLVASRFLRSEDGKYTFRHDLLRLHVYQQIDPEQRAAWHRQTAAYLRRSGCPLATVAWHLAQGQQPQEASAFYQQAAVRALALHAQETAVQYADQATTQAKLANLSPAETVSLRWLHLNLAHLARPASSHLPDINALADDARQVRDDETLLRLLLLKFDLMVGQGRLVEAEPVRDEILALVAGVGNRPLESDALLQIAIKTAFVMGDATQGVAYARRGVQLAADRPSQPELLAEAKLVLAACLLRGRQRDSALAVLADIQAILAAHPNLHQVESDWLYLWAVAAQFTGDWDEAHRLHEQSLQRHRQTGNFYALTTALYNTANSASVRGAHEQAIVYATEMVALADEQLAADDYQKKLSYRVMLATCYLNAEDHAGALAALSPLYQWLAEEATGAAGVMGWGILGGISLVQEDWQSAYQAYGRAVTMSDGLSSISPTPFLGQAEACVQLGRMAEGQALLAQAAMRINFDGPSTQTQTYYHYVRYLLTQEVDALLQAEATMHEQAQRFADPAVREAYLMRHLLHRQIAAAAEKRRPPPLVVELARTDAPLGRPLTDAEMVSVRWTVDDGAGDTAVLAEQGKKALRQHRLQRLMAEAKAQGAAPTYTDLAQALQVSERTIARDIRWLIQVGTPVHTRRR